MAFGNKPESLDGLVKKFLKNVPQRKELQRGMVLHYWPKVVGERIASVSKNVHFKNGRLIVTVSNQAWRHEIHANRYSIMKKLNQKVGNQIVKEMVVRS